MIDFVPHFWQIFALQPSVDLIRDLFYGWLIFLRCKGPNKGVDQLFHVRSSEMYCGPYSRDFGDGFVKQTHKSLLIGVTIFNVLRNPYVTGEQITVKSLIWRQIGLGSCLIRSSETKKT